MQTEANERIGRFVMQASRLRCLGVEAIVTGAAGSLAALLAPGVVAAGSTFEDLLVRGCATVGLAALAWLWLAATVVVAEALFARPGPVPPAAWVPRLVRRAVLAACGASLAVGLAGPVHATPQEQHRELPQARGSASGLAGLPYPDRPGGRPGSTARAEVVVVRPGDSLWAIAEHDLGPAATNADVEARWRDIYAANRAAVGADPDLIRPAVRLRLPPRTADRAKETP
jgi:hypothetical protein